MNFVTLFRSVFPYQCFECGEESTLPLCEGCRRMVQGCQCENFMPPSFESLPLSEEYQGRVSDLQCDTLISPLCYTGIVKEFLPYSKVYGYPELAKVFILQTLISLEPWLSENRWDAIIPIAPHPGRTLKRRFHFPALLADAVARRTTGEPTSRKEKSLLIWNSPWAIFSQNTRPTQKNSQPIKKFRLNKINLSIKDRSILLVDDVITTGNTLKQAIRLIKKQNPRRLDVLTLAHVHNLMLS